MNTGNNNGSKTCVCIRDVPYGDFEFKKGSMYEFGGMTADMDYIVLIDSTNTYFTEDEFNSWFKLITETDK